MLNNIHFMISIYQPDVDFYYFKVLFDSITLFLCTAIFIVPSDKNLSKPGHLFVATLCFCQIEIIETVWCSSIIPCKFRIAKNKQD